MVPVWDAWNQRDFQDPVLLGGARPFWEKPEQKRRERVLMDDRQVPRSGGAGQRGTEVGAVPVFPVSPSHPHTHSRPSPDWTRPTHEGGQPALLNSTDVTASLLQKRPHRNIDHICGTRSSARLTRELPTKTLTGVCTGHHVPPLCWGAGSCCDAQDQESGGM